jgi:hypothetical protein
MRALFCVMYVNPLDNSPPPPYTRYRQRSALQFQIQVSDSYSGLNLKRVNCRVQNVELLCLFSRNKRNLSRTSIFRLLHIWQSYTLIFSL